MKKSSVAMDKVTLERVVKAVVNWNGKEVDFVKRFLELQDNFDLEAVDIGDGTIKLKTKLKE
jgi:hypothetical protein